MTESASQLIHNVIHTVHTADSPISLRPKSFLASHFAPAFYFLEPERRRALKVMYAVFRVLDDAVDKPGQAEPHVVVEAWRRCLQEKSPASLTKLGFGDVAGEWLSVMKKYDIPEFTFLDFLRDGVEADLRGQRFETPMDTERYCYGVAGTVGVACLPIFGVPWQEAKDYAVRLGVAVQWTNIVRDVGLDADMGRVYLPLEHLSRFGVTPEQILERRESRNFTDLMRYEGEVARSHYRRAAELMPPQWERKLLPARIMGEIYLKLLAKIQKHEYPVLTTKITLNTLEKGLATCKALWN